MATHRTAICRIAGLASIAAASAAAVACSSSNNLGSAPDASVDAGAVDGGNLTLQWKVVYFGTPPTTSDAGASDAGPRDASPGDTAGDAAEDAGPSHPLDGGLLDATGIITTLDVTVDGSIDIDGDTDAGASDAGVADLSVLPPLSGVTVCVYQNAAIPCATTGADGTFSLTGLPPRTDVSITFKKAGFTPDVVPIETSSDNMDGRSNPIYMTPITVRPPAIGVPLDFTTKGVINAFAVSLSGGGADGGGFAGVPGTSMAMTPMSGNGPYFVGNDNTLSLTATSFIGATALYYNVAPGTYTLTYSNATFDCEPISFPFGQFGYPVTTPAHSLKLVVLPGYITGIVGVACTMSAPIVQIDGG